jgi:hypothetical protein
MNNNESQPDRHNDFEPWKAGESHDEFVQRALEHHARTGEWPPDPLLDEVAEMRRRVAAEDGYGLRKYLERMDLQEAETARHVPDPAAVE